MRRITTKKAFRNWLLRLPKTTTFMAKSGKCCPLAVYCDSGLVGSNFYGDLGFGSEAMFRLPRWAVRFIERFDRTAPAVSSKADALAAL